MIRFGRLPVCAGDLAPRIPSEREEYMRPLLDKTAALFGDPLATVRDLGDGIEGGPPRFALAAAGPTVS